MSHAVFALFVVERRNNFPPLPGWFPVKPCFYQDFDVDIPVEFQQLVRSIYRLWQGDYCLNSCNSQLCTFSNTTILSCQDFAIFAFCYGRDVAAYTGALLINVFGALTYLIASVHNGIDNRSGSTFVMSIICAVIFTPCSFVCWYRPVYKAFR